MNCVDFVIFSCVSFGKKKRDKIASFKDYLSQHHDVAKKLETANLTHNTIQNLKNDLLLETLLEKAGIESPGERAAIIIAVRE